MRLDMGYTRFGNSAVFRLALYADKAESLKRAGLASAATAGERV
jgi:hypothetical protein